MFNRFLNQNYAGKNRGKKVENVFFIHLLLLYLYILKVVSHKIIIMRNILEDDKERTLVAVLNEGLIPFKRIIPNSDNAFELDHRILQTRKKIVLFFTPLEECTYKMFIFCKEDGASDEVTYDNMENTWSVYNTLCQTLYNQYFINKVKTKQLHDGKNPPV